MQDTNEYARYIGSQRGVFAPVTDPEELLSRGTYRVLTPDECVEQAETAGSVTLKPLVGGDLSRVVYVTYGHPALPGGEACPGGRHGFDVHPAFALDPDRLKPVADFVSNNREP